MGLVDRPLYTPPVPALPADAAFFCGGGRRPCLQDATHTATGPRLAGQGARPKDWAGAERSYLAGSSVGSGYAGGVWWHHRFRSRGTQPLRESGGKWVDGGARPQRERTLRAGYIGPGRVPSGVLGDNGVVVVDDFLSPEALEAMRWLGEDAIFISHPPPLCLFCTDNH
jgi:hypothetical protein